MGLISCDSYCVVCLTDGILLVSPGVSVKTRTKHWRISNLCMHTRTFACTLTRNEEGERACWREEEERVVRCREERNTIACDKPTNSVSGGSIVVCFKPIPTQKTILLNIRARCPYSTEKQVQFMEMLLQTNTSILSRTLYLDIRIVSVPFRMMLYLVVDVLLTGARTVVYRKRRAGRSILVTPFIIDDHGRFGECARACDHPLQEQGHLHPSPSVLNP